MLSKTGRNAETHVDAAQGRAPKRFLIARRLTGFRLVRFGLAGACAAATDLILFWVVNQGLGWSRWSSQVLSRSSGGLVSFTLNKVWTFDNREMRRVPVQLLRYATIWGAAYLCSTLLIEVYRFPLRGAPRADFSAKVLAEGTLGLVSFLLQRFWVFRRGAR